MRYVYKIICALVALALALSTAPAKATDTSAFTVDDMLDVVNLNIADLSSDGRWLAVQASTLGDRIGVNNYRFGDPTYIAPQTSEVWIIDTQSAKSQKLFPDKRQTRSLRWSPDASRLAFFLLRGDRYEPVIWERATNRFTSIKLPSGRYAAENSDLEWSEDGAKVFFALRTEEWRAKAKEKFEYETRGPIVAHSSREPFLAWDELRRMNAIRSLVAYDLKTAQVREVLPETRINSYNLSEDGSFISFFEDITKKTDYDVIAGAESQVRILPSTGGESRVILKSTKGINLLWSKDGRRYAYSKDGQIFFASIEDAEPRQLTGKKEEKEKTETADKPADADKQRERFNVVRLSPTGDRLVASNKEGLWIIDTASATRELFLKMPEEDKEAPRYQVTEWSDDGIYLTYSSRTRWERGLSRYDTKTKKMEDLFRDSRLHSGFRLSKDGRAFVFASAEGNRPADLYSADAAFTNVRRLTDANPQLKAKKLSRTELVSYLDADGTRSYGVLYYPADYEAGKKYPTVLIIYEQFFDDNFNSTINILTSSGYAVMQPSVNFETGFPGEAWTKGVTAAANKLIEMGVSDPERLGVQGTSYGGYATNLLITETSRFRAAINISGKVNMVSFYTDSPRLGVRNIHAPEKSQDRLGATLWQQPQKYIQHSAIMFADRIKTPLLLITGEQDHNVPARQAMEMYYALRRLGKKVEWVNYTNGGHGMPTTTVDEVKDYHRRIVQWYDDHLKSTKGHEGIP
jgi:dipeptidyl aminopeptidase/acylaminoacyl peptidase